MHKDKTTDSVRTFSTIELIVKFNKSLGVLFLIFLQLYQS